MNPREVVELFGRRGRRDPLALCVSVADLRLLARRRVPASVFDFIEGGAEDECTLRRNREALGRQILRPRVLTGVEEVDLTRTILGVRRRYPFVLGPTGFTRVIHFEGEAAVATAAAKHGVPYTVSIGASNTHLDDLARPGPQTLWLGLYPFRDRGITRELLAMGQERGYEALVLTVDVPVAGGRERDLRNGFTVPPRLGVKTALDALCHPRWLYGMLTSPAIGMPNIPTLTGGITDSTAFPELFARNMTWDDLAEIRTLWSGPIVLKGVMTAEDAARAADAGVQAVVVSNHGGRQLDGAAAAIDVLQEVVQHVGGDLEVLVDSGFRRGREIAVALAKGASGVMLARSYLYGLAAGGSRGVERVLEILSAELTRSLHLAGVRAVDDLGPQTVAATVEPAAR